MLEFRPALQFIVKDSVPVLFDMLGGRHFAIESDELLASIACAIDLTPCEKRELEVRLALKARIALPRAKEIVVTLLEKGILCDSSLLRSERAAVQAWVDHGWIDAFVLHFASRNLRYADDPPEFGGEGAVAIGRARGAIEGKHVGRAFLLREPEEGAVSSEALLDAIKRRRSFKPFLRRSLYQGDIDDILWYSNTQHRERSRCSQSSKEGDNPFDSAFACLSTFVVLYVESPAMGTTASAGIYSYDVLTHSLHCVKQGDFRSEIQRIACGQKRASAGLFSLIIAGDWSSYARIYPHERSYRNILVNVGELAQNYLIWSTHKNLNTFMSPAFADEEMMALLEVSGRQPFYLIAAG